MYFPYLRGKQFELIALKESLSLIQSDTAKISPIIEPVKNSTSFINILRSFKDSNINFTIIINPFVGDLQKSTITILNLLITELANYENYQIGILLNERVNHNSLHSLLQKYKSSITSLSLIHIGLIDNISEIASEYGDIIPVKYNIIHFGKTNRRYYRNFDSSTIVELDDYFSIQPKNSDYKKNEISDFTEEHLFYKQDGFVGYSDYLTIGDNYSESGFLPYAVAIHLSFPDKSNKLKIRHFVSDNNNDTSDIAGKFSEALNKLIDWCKKNKFKSNATLSFETLHKAGHFPGLGTIKKLSILNHIEVVLKLI